MGFTAKKNLWFDILTIMSEVKGKLSPHQSRMRFVLKSEFIPRYRLRLTPIYHRSFVEDWYGASIGAVHFDSLRLCSGQVAQYEPPHFLYFAGAFLVPSLSRGEMRLP
ncbi:MAG: hypothetical protein A2847_00355 [Candidatus Sungbacteria bacterium RIFCSPHIGHO2_01_FULL_50_25]|uniref:Uncharacterized protein n=1 Tax=Candidatus Sungbacteria bacterium RIFCSPHIGHO2_01_FULL_50_25 TaxID=1802265 RepID=A0A1G2K9T1_9BACT|nr:MAG: hypothetical protein A2847_00355 [Candidatus Sungbacteria bacterium RIFCSPHIGHO2_01_FULL_50_25]